MKRLKLWIAVLVLACTVTTAHALLPIAGAIAWLGGAVTANAGLVTGIEASLYVHAGAYAIYSIFFAQKDSSGKPSGTPALEVKLNPSAKRANPDPSKFDDPANGARDVTPKASIAPPAGGADTALPPVGGRVWCNYNNQGRCSPNYYGSTVVANSAGQALSELAKHKFNQLKAIYPTIVSYAPDYASGHADVGTSPYPGGAYKITNENGSTSSNFFNVTVMEGELVESMSCVGTWIAGQCKQSQAACPPGYTASGSMCNLSNPAEVKKPDNWPCEVLRTSSGLQVDTANPNCAAVQVSGNTIQPTSDQAVSFNADNSVSISNPAGQTTINLGQPNADGSVPITGASRSGSPSSYTPGTGGSTTCGGVGQPACSGTTNPGTGTGGSCGGAGQPACSIDDSGMAGKNADMTGANGALDQNTAERSGLFDKAKQSVITPTWGWTMPVQAQSCQSLEFGQFGPLNFKLDWCKYLPLMQQAISFLAYCFTALFLFQLVFGTSNKESK